MSFDGVEEVAEEGTRAGEAVGGDSAPAVPGKGGAEEIEEGAMVEDDVGENIHGGTELCKPIERLAEQIKSMPMSHAVAAKILLDKKLMKARVIELTGDDAFTAFSHEVKTFMKSQALLSTEQQKLILQVLNKKGDITSISVGERGTINLLGVSMLLFKVNEITPFTPAIIAAIEYAKRFF